MQLEALFQPAVGYILIVFTVHVWGEGVGLVAKTTFAACFTLNVFTAGVC